MKYDLICIGVLSLDTIVEIPFLPQINSECFVRRIWNAHGGAAANVAAYSAFYGGLRAGLVSKIGSDEIGEDLLKRMEEYGVCTKGVGILENSLSTKIITIQHPEGGRSYLVYLGAIEKLSRGIVPQEYIQDSILFYIAPCTAQTHKEFMEIGVKGKKLIAFNPGSVYFQQEPKINFYQLLKFVDFLFVNEEEAFFYSNEGTTESAGFSLQRLGARYVIITNNDFGCTVFSQGRSEIFPGYKADQKCLIGAGDAFAAGFLSEFLKTGNIQSAALMGNLFGAFGITQPELRKAAPQKEKFLEFLQLVRSVT
jgi:ribokinase